MEDEYTKRTKLKLLVLQFLLPNPMELIPYFFVSLLALLVASNQLLLVILAGNSPVTPLSTSEVFGQRLDYISELLATPVLGRIVLFVFWLGIGSVVYMAIWMFQNLAVDVYDNLITAKIKGPKSGELAEGWWGSPSSHIIFGLASTLLFIFFTTLTMNVLFPAWLMLFQIGLQSLSELGSIIKIIISVIGTMVTLHVFILFWKLFSRMRKLYFQ